MEVYVNNRFHPDGLATETSSYPESETSYFNRRYGSDCLVQLRDKHQWKCVQRYVLPSKRKEILTLWESLAHFKCSNVPGLKAGRSAIILRDLADNLRLFQAPECRSLRWNRNYQKALTYVRELVMRWRDEHGRTLQSFGHAINLEPVSLQAVVNSGLIQSNLNKNAGYIAFESGKRSKGENLKESVEWCVANRERIIASGDYGLPAVLSHRSSNSKVDDFNLRTFKSRTRVVLMQDLRAQLLDGRFAIPFTKWFTENVGFGEGGMEHSEIQSWINTARLAGDSYYSSDYSKFDVSQASWLIEDVFYHIVKPCFGRMTDQDEELFNAMVNSYVNKTIHTPWGAIRVHHGNISGSVWTYIVNTIINQVMDSTSHLMQCCNPAAFFSLKCGDDNITFYRKNDAIKFDIATHCRLIRKYFGIKTTIEPTDFGSTENDPTFLSRTWTYAGATRPIYDVLWNLQFTERFRDYERSGLPIKQAEALVLACGCYEQPRTMREFFNVEAILRDAGNDDFIAKPTAEHIYKTLATMGSGFADPWIITHLSNSRMRGRRA